MAHDGAEGEPRSAKTGRAAVIATLATGLVIGAALILDREEAQRPVQLGEEIHPDDGRVFMLRGDLLGLQNRFTEAIAQYERAIQIDEHRAGIPARQKIELVRSMMEQDTGP